MYLIVAALALLVGGVVGWVAARRSPALGMATALEGATPVLPARATDTDAPRLRAAFDALPIGVVIGDRAGTVTYRNQLAASFVGARHSDVLVDEAVERHLVEATHGHDRSQTLELFGPPKKVIVVRASPIDGGDSGALVTIEDVTERSRVDAVRTDFVANISHELKTPIGAMIVLAEALVGCDDADVAERLAGKVADEAVRLGQTVDDLLELSRIELGGDVLADEVDAEVIVTGAVDRVRPLAEGHGVIVRLECPAAPIGVVGDRRQLISALGNLVENAVKYSEQGGVVTVGLVEREGHVEFSVADHGLGIPSRDLDRVFERFYRVDRARSRDTGGTGLGLAIVRNVASNHGGEVGVTSLEGEGSTFTLRIPRRRVGGERRTGGSASAPATNQATGS